MKSMLACSGNDGNLQLLLCDPDGDGLFLIWQSARDGSWQNFGLIPNTSGLSFSKMAAANNGWLNVVGLNQGWPYLVVQNPQGGWAPQGYLPGRKPGYEFVDLAMGVGNDGNIQLILIRPDFKIILMWQDKNTGNWSDGPPLPFNSSQQFSRVYAANGNSANLQVLAVTRDTPGQFQGVWQSASGGDWHQTSGLPASATAPEGEAAFGAGNDLNLQLVYVDQNRNLQFIWQSNRDGSWNKGFTLPNNPAGRILFSGVAAARSVPLPMVGPPLLFVFGFGKDLRAPEAYQHGYFIFQDPSGGWHWGGPLLQELNDQYGYTAVTCGMGNEGRVQAVLLNSIGAGTLFWQNSPGDPGFNRFPGYLFGG